MAFLQHATLQSEPGCPRGPAATSPTLMKKYKRILPRAARSVRHFFRGSAITPFPFIPTLHRYNLTRAGKDCRAAIDVALVGLPQGMAFAAMAGLDSIYGIMAATVGTFVAPLFSKSRLTVSGPSNATAFMLASFFLAHPVISPGQKAVLVPLIVFFAGLFCVAGAFFKVTELLQYVSRSVLVGYIIGAATLIIASQMRDILGIEAPGGSSFFTICESLVTHASSTRWQPIVLACATFALYETLRRRFRRLPVFAIVLAAMSLVNHLLAAPWAGGLFADVARLRDFTMSDIALRPPALLNADIFSQIYDLFPVVFGIAFLSTLEQTIMSRSIAAKTGESLNPAQDTFAVGMANIASSFTTSLPCSASLTRTTINYNAGASSRFASLYCGLLCLGATLLLAVWPIISAIPRSVLAALILANAFSLYDRHAIRICFRSTRGDAAVLAATALAALLLPLHTAIFIGVALSVSVFLHKAARPELVEYTMDSGGSLKEIRHRTERVPQISIVHVEGDLFFGAAELFRSQLQRIAEDPSLAVIILRLKNAHNLDATSVFALEELIRFTREKGRHLIISGASKAVYRILRRSGVLQTLQQGCGPGERNIFLATPRNPNVSTRKALLRAQELIGTRNAGISIYFNPDARPNSGQASEDTA